MEGALDTDLIALRKIPHACPVGQVVGSTLMTSGDTHAVAITPINQAIGPVPSQEPFLNGRPGTRLYTGVCMHVDSKSLPFWG